MDDDALQIMVSSQRQWLETQILALSLTDPKFFSECCRMVCREHDGEKVEDFQNPYDNIIFEGARLFYETTGAAVAPPRGFLTAWCEGACEKSDILQHEMPSVYNRLNECSSQVVSGIDLLVRKAVPIWLKTVRSRRHMSEAVSRANTDFDKVLDKLKMSQSAIKAATGQQSPFRSLREILEQKVVVTQRYGLSLTNLNKVMDGGLGRKEAALVVTAEGGGKTVLGMQAASEWTILHGLKGLFISTEQGPEELYPRMVSCHCDIPFDIVKDGINLDRLSPEERERVVRLTDATETLKIMKWQTIGQRSIVQDLDDELKRYADEHGGIDFLVFDWLGRGVGNLNDRQVNNLRYYMQQAADHMADMAAQYNIMCLYFAQANLKQALNKARVDATMINECKALGQNATWVIGVSAMMTELAKAQASADHASYQPEQNMFVSKGRKSQGGLAKVLRKFRFQRFVDR